MQRMMIAFALSLLFTGLATASDPFTNPWTDAEESGIASQGARDIQPLTYRTVALDISALAATLSQAPLAGQSYVESAGLTIELPFPDGSSQRFLVEEAPIMAPALAAKYPKLRTYRAQGLDDPTATARLDLTPKGFHAMVMSTSGSVWIDPYQRNDVEHHVVYNRRDYRRAEPVDFVCGVGAEPVSLTSDLVSDHHRPADKLGGLPSNGGSLRTYRVAIAATGEYTAFHSAGAPTVAEGLAAIVIAMNRVNGIYERELSMTMELIADNDQIIYTNGGTDPYTNNSGGAMLGQNQSNIDSVIGAANYDIGHVFSTGGGGVASLRVPCVNGSKARGVTGLGSPTGDIFWVDFVSHEMGHQWGGNHPFNGSSGNCSGGNRNPATAYEPGSGSTIQAYAGICGAQNLQPNSDDYFHTISLQEMANYTNTGNGNNCPVTTGTGNGIPTVDAGSSFTIPLDTPFELCATGSDPDSHPLTYNWEQFDLGPAGHPDSPVGDAPIFRSWPATDSPCRTFPLLSDILTGTHTIGELLPTYARTLTFRVTARDNRMEGGAFQTDEVDIVVSDASGPFAVTAPNTAVTWQGGVNETVTWDVGGTDLAPVNCTQVDILLSDDGGQTFAHTLISNAANDGSQSVTPPFVSTTEARVKVACSNNIFFDISTTDFTVEGSSMIFEDGFESADTTAWSSTSP